MGATANITINITSDLTAETGTVALNEVAGGFTVTVNRTGGTDGAVSAVYALTNGTTTAGSDYTAVTGVLNFGVNETTKTITVVVIGDTLKELNETFFVNLSSPSNATISRSQGIGVIVDDDRAVIAEFDNDGKTDFSVFRPSNGTWYIQRSSDFGTIQQQFGLGTDKPAQGDYNGDGRTDIAVWRPSNGTWYVLTSGASSQFTAVSFGISTDVPVQGDYDGDERTDYAVYRSGIWYVLNSANSVVTAINFGLSNDKPLVGDFDGDGKSDFTVYRSGVWYIFQTQTNTSRAIAFGTTTDIPTVGDYDGDGTADIAVFRPSTGVWYVLQSSNGAFTGQRSSEPTATSRFRRAINRFNKHQSKRQT